MALAALYDELLQDRSAARELLERAWKNDPGSKEVAEAFRTRGYHRVKDQWVDTTPTGRGCGRKWCRYRVAQARYLVVGRFTRQDSG